MLLLSFDLEEFDMPLEYGKTISFEEQIHISIVGSHRILDLLQEQKVKATFFCTAVFALHAPEIVRRIKDEGHEPASHSYYHSHFQSQDLLASKQKLEEIFGLPIEGFRMPRMMPVDEKEIAGAGYLFNSSINPTFLPGRYNNLKVSRTYFVKEGVLQLPASVSPFLRIPLFWLSFHNFPLWLYKYLFRKVYQKDGYVNIYFHPWEFTDITDKNKFGFAGYISKNSGQQMIKRMEKLLTWINNKGYPNSTIGNFIKIVK